VTETVCSLTTPSSGVAQEKYTNAFLGYGPEGDRFFSLELTYNYGKESYDLGSGFGHFALGVPDVYKTVDSIKAAGARSDFKPRLLAQPLRSPARLAICVHFPFIAVRAQQNW